jgi:predicted nucleic acid-binding protein
MTDSSQPSLIILDNTVLSNFSQADAEDLLLGLWSKRICTTQAVLEEYELAVQAGLLPGGAWEQLLVLTLDEEERGFANRSSRRLGAGERTCLAAAWKRNGVFASDDADARAAAQKWGIPVTGTVGILLHAVKRSLLSLSQANRLLRKMITAGYHSPVDRLDELL